MNLLLLIVLMPLLAGLLYLALSNKTLSDEELLIMLEINNDRVKASPNRYDVEVWRGYYQAAKNKIKKDRG